MIVKVKDKYTGQVGTIDDSEMSARYEPVGQTSQSAPVSEYRPTASTIPAQNQTGEMSGIVGSILNPFIRTGRNIAGGGYEAARGISSLLGNKNAYVNQETGQTTQNPFLSEEQLNTFNNNGKTGVSNLANKGMAQQLKSSANIASWAVPFGKGGNLVTKAILPGMTVGGMQGASSDNATPNSVIRDIVLGGATAGVLSKGTDLLGKGLTKLGGAEQNLGNNITSGVRKIKQPASVYGAGKEKAINQTLTDLGFKGSPAKQYANLEPAMNKLEGKINEVVANNPGVTVSTKAIKSSFLDNLKSALRSKDLTNKQAQAEVEGYINDLMKESSGGSSLAEMGLGQLRNLKKLVNQDYGAVDDILARGGTLTPRQRVVMAAWDSLDGAVKTASPEMKKLLAQESNLYKAAPSLSGARFNPPTLRVAGTSLPPVVSQTGQDLAGRTVGGVGKFTKGVGGIFDKASQSQAVPLGGAELVTRILNPSVAQTGQNEYNDAQNQGGQYDTTGNLNHGDIISQPTKTLTGYTVDQHAQAYQAAMQAGDTYSAKKIYAEYEKEAAYQKSQTGSGKPLNSAQVTQVNLAKSGLRGLNKAEQLLGLRDESGAEIPNAKVKMGTLTKQLVPGNYLTRDYEAAAFSATEALLRARSGAAVPETEVKRYTQKLFPVFGDSEAVVRQKLAELRNIFGDITNQQGAGNEDVIQSILNP